MISIKLFSKETGYSPSLLLWLCEKRIISGTKMQGNWQVNEDEAINTLAFLKVVALKKRKPSKGKWQRKDG